MPDLPDTLTAAHTSAGVVFLHITQDRTDTNARTIPYAEWYRGFTARLKTPIERLQEVTDAAEAETE